MYFSFILCNFSMRTLKYFQKIPQNVEKTTSKSCLLIAIGSLFFSAAPLAQNSPELHFCFINSSIHYSALKSVVNRDSFYTNFTNKTFQKIPIPHLTCAMKLKFLHWNGFLNFSIYRLYLACWMQFLVNTTLSKDQK